MNTDRCDSTIASPTIPGMANKSIADAHIGAGTFFILNIATQITAVTMGDTKKAIQYCNRLPSNTRCPR